MSGARSRWRALSGIAVAMMLHDKAKLAGALAGVLFATILSTQQAATFLVLLDKNTMLQRRSGADIWITPPSTQVLQPGKPLPERVLHQTRAVDGVAWAAPLLFTAGAVALPAGGSEQVSLLGIDLDGMHGGPWNVVAGDARDLAMPDAVIFEDSEREKLGGLNLGSVREINGKRVQVVGLTWGLLPFGPSYAFSSYDKAREIAGQRDRSQSFVLVGVAPGQDVDAVAERLRAQVSGVAVHTRPEFERIAIRFVLTNTPVGIVLGSATLFGLVVGFVIVAIAMFSAVLDNLREFGTLAAIGARTRDLAVILLVQAVIYGLIGTGTGLVIVGFIVRAVHSPRLDITLPPWLMLAVLAVMLLICVGATSLALLRLRKIEPGMVFRG